MTKPTTHHELEIWLKDCPPEFAVAMAARIAMRTVPYLVEALYNRPSDRRTRFVLPTLCALASATFTARWPECARDTRKAARRIVRELSDAFYEEDNGIQISGIEWREISEPPPSDYVRDARAFPLSARAILSSAYAAQAATDFLDVPRGLASSAAPADATTSCLRIACRNRSDAEGATFLELPDVDSEEKDQADSEFDPQSVNAALADASQLEDALADAQPTRQAARDLTATLLWQGDLPVWAGRKWADLIGELPDDEQWWVWTDWYEAHLAATPLNETVELARAMTGTRLVEGVLGVNAHLVATIKANTDPLGLAVEHARRSADAFSDTVDFNAHWRRIQRSLPDDPAEVVGATKDMLESVMKTILERRGKPVPANIDFPSLTDRCLRELGLQSRSQPATPAERHARKFASTAATMIKTISRLRNDAGTGHGRADSSNDSSRLSGLSVPDARLAAATTLLLSAWLLHHDDARSSV